MCALATAQETYFQNHPTGIDEASIKIIGNNRKPCHWGSEDQVKFLSLAFKSSLNKPLNMHHCCRTEKKTTKPTLCMVFHNLIYRAKTSNGLDRLAERNDEELLQLHPVHCSFTNSQVIPVARLA